MIYRSPVQRALPTLSQRNVRSTFSATAGFWNSLSLDQQADWSAISAVNPIPNRFGAPTIVSGYAYFARMMQLTFQQSSGSALIPDLSNDPAYEFSPGASEAVIEMTNAGFVLNFFTLTAETISDSTVPNRWNVYVSLPVVDPTLPYFKTWYFAGSGTFDANLGTGAPLEFMSAGKILPGGFRAFPGATVLFKAICFLPDQGGISVERIWSAVPTFIPQSDFPVFTLPAGDPSISFDFADGIFDYFWTTAQKSEILASYGMETQLAMPVSGTPPIPELDWVTDIQTYFDPGFGPTTIVPLPIPDYGDWYGNWWEFIGQLWTPAFGMNAPVRARLVNLSTLEPGPWVVGYWPILLS